MYPSSCPWSNLTDSEPCYDAHVSLVSCRLSCSPIAIAEPHESANVRVHSNTCSFDLLSLVVYFQQPRLRRFTGHVVPQETGKPSSADEDEVGVTCIIMYDCADNEQRVLCMSLDRKSGQPYHL